MAEISIILKNVITKLGDWREQGRVVWFPSAKALTPFVAIPLDAINSNEFSLMDPCRPIYYVLEVKAKKSNGGMTSVVFEQRLERCT